LEEGPEEEEAEEEAEEEVDEVKAGVLKGSVGELDPHPQDQAHPGKEVEEADQVHAP
jgi:hypothetical protein